MKKILVFTMLLLLLTSCFKKEEKIEKPKKEEVKQEKVEEKILSQEEIEKQRWEISIDDLDLLLAWEKINWNELLQKGKKFLDNLNATEKDKITEKVDWWIKFSDFENEIGKVSDNLKREINLEIDIFDYKTKEKVSSWVVYMNKIRLWEFTNWKFEKNFYWPIWIEQFKIMVRTENYWDWFLNINSINSNGSLIIWEVYLKKATIVKDFDLDKNIDYKWENLNFSFDKCSLVKDWECFNWKTDLKINFVKWEEVNNYDVSLNMKALTKEWKIVNLQSWGMAFLDFITKDWDILKLKDWKNIKITYKVTEEDIKSMGINKTWKNMKNGYWWYNKNRWLWIEWESNFLLDKTNKTWSIITPNLY